MADRNYVLFFPENCPTGIKTKQTKKKSFGESVCCPKHMGHLRENRWNTYLHLSTNQFPNNKAALQLCLRLVSFLGVNCCHSFFFFFFFAITEYVCYGAAVSQMTNVGSAQTPIVMTTAETDATLPVFYESMFIMLWLITWKHQCVCVCLRVCAPACVCARACVCKMACEGERREVGRDNTAVQINECSGLGWVSSMFPAGSGVTEHCTAAGEHTTARKWSLRATKCFIFTLNQGFWQTQLVW